MVTSPSDGPVSDSASHARLCLVTGATGAIGPRLVRALRDEGHSVRILTRTQPETDLLPAEIEIATGDVADERAVRAAMTDVQWVFHLAAKLHVANPPPSLHPEYERVNVEGTRHVVHAAQSVSAERLVFFSTISVYAPSSGTPLSESSPSSPETIYGTTKLAAEQIVRTSTTRSGGPLGAVLRLAAVYGPRVKGNYRRLLDALARGRFVPIGRGNNRRTLIFEDDVARAAILAAGHPSAAGSIFNVTDGTTPQLADIIIAMCAALGRRPPSWSLPLAPVRFGARVADSMARAAGRRLTIGAAVDKYLEDVAVDGRRIHDVLGFTPAFALDAGWRRTVEALRQRGEL